MKFRKTNKKPPIDARCHASIGIDSSSKQPKILMCNNKATVEYLGLSIVGETWLCESCAKKIIDKYNIT